MALFWINDQYGKLLTVFSSRVDYIVKKDCLSEETER